MKFATCDYCGWNWLIHTNTHYSPNLYFNGVYAWKPAGPVQCIQCGSFNVRVKAIEPVLKLNRADMLK